VLERERFYALNYSMIATI
jgi:hypothetical protein